MIQSNNRFIREKKNTVTKRLIWVSCPTILHKHGVVEDGGGAKY